MYRLILTFLLVLPIAAHSTKAFSASETPTKLRVATFQCEVTLPLGHILYSKPLATIEHPLQARGVVLEQGGRRYVLCAVDWCTMRNLTHRMFREKVAAGAGVDISCVAVQCVHQHTAPSHDGSAQVLLNKQENPPSFRDLKFLAEVTDRLGQAVKQSLANLQEADRIGFGQAKVDRVASIRRLLSPEGKPLTRYSACTNPKLIAMPEGNIDPWIKTITFAQGDRPLVRLHYYATHPQSFYLDGRASYDVPGIARQKLEDKEGVFQIYFTGCAGDVAMGKYNNRTREARTALAERLFQGMEASALATKYGPIGLIQWRTVSVPFTSRETSDTLAKKRTTLEDPKADSKARIGAASKIACAERLKQPVELSSLQMGNIHILHLPGEPMVEFQHYAQKVMPKQTVAVAGYGLGSTGYICTEEAFTIGGYEPSASAVVPSSEKLLKKAIDQLLGK